MFSADQVGTSGRPVLKPGIWRIVSPGCEASHELFCSLPLVEIDANNIRLARELLSKMPPSAPNDCFAKQEHLYVISGGEPILIQFQLTGCSPGSEPNTETMYFFAAVQPSEKDADGNISAAYVWPVMCGPFPKPGDLNYGMNDDERYITNHPFPELQADGRGGCKPKNTMSLRSAARKSRDVTGSYLARWIADEKHQTGTP